MQFASDDPTEQSAALKNFGDMVYLFGQARQLPNRKLTLLHLQRVMTIQTLVQGINSLRGDPSSFLQVNPVFQTEDAEMAITDELIATFACQ